MTSLRYPMEVGGGASPDYVMFTPMEYRANARGGPQQAGGGAPGQAGAQAVVLYMPNDTPQISNPQEWGAQSFLGPIGEIRRDLGMAATNAIYGTKPGQSVSEMKETMTNALQQAKGSMASNMRGAAQQGLMQVSAALAGASANQVLAMTRGEVYNPNVELLYTQPGMRDFGFTFKFVPKNPGEAAMVNRIIQNFKKWSAPADLGNGMFKVPMVWQVQYMTGSSDNNNMNKFKPAACVGVTVAANPQTTMHVAFEDGMPIETVMSLNFKEVDIILREDHEEGNQGY